MKLRDNCKLFVEVDEIICDALISDRKLRAGASIHIDMLNRILDAVDRATATGPAPGKCNRDVSCDNCGAKLHHGGAATGPGSGAAAREALTKIAHMSCSGPSSPEHCPVCVARMVVGGLASSTSAAPQADHRAAPKPFEASDFDGIHGRATPPSGSPPGAAEHNWQAFPGMGWECKTCAWLRRVKGDGELSTTFEYRPLGKRVWQPVEPPCDGTGRASPPESPDGSRGTR